MKDKKWWRMIKWKKALFPHWFVIVSFILISTVLLIYSLGYKEANPIIAYFSYAFSAYTLTIFVARMPRIIKKIKIGLYKNKYSNIYLSEAEVRAKTSLYVGNGVNVLYSVVHLSTKFRWPPLFLLYRNHRQSQTHCLSFRELPRTLSSKAVLDDRLPS